MSKPPPKGDFWRAFAAVTILPINGSQKAVLGCLIDHANPKNGLCYPREALIAAETAIPIRTVERVMEVGKSRAKWLASRPDARMRSWVITMSFDECGELISYLECSLDEDGDEISGGGIERCDERWNTFAICVDAEPQNFIGEA